MPPRRIAITPLPRRQPPRAPIRHCYFHALPDHLRVISFLPLRCYITATAAAADATLRCCHAYAMLLPRRRFDIAAATMRLPMLRCHATLIDAATMIDATRHELRRCAAAFATSMLMMLMAPCRVYATLRA